MKGSPRPASRRGMERIEPRRRCLALKLEPGCAVKERNGQLPWENVCMFLFHLTPLERTSFVGLAKHLVGADGREGAAETEALQLIEGELGTPVAGIPAMEPSPEVLATFVTRASRAALVLELLTLAYADGLPHPDEMEMLKVVASGVGISELRLLEMEDWVVQQMPLTAQANAFLTQEE